MRTLVKYLAHGVAWGCFWLVSICVVMDFAHPDGLHGLFDNFTVHALGSVVVGIGCATTPIVYEIDRLRRWQQMTIHATVGLGIFFSVGFGLGWLPAGSPAAVVFSLVTSVLIFIVIWFGFYLYDKHEAKKINDRIKEKNLTDY
ncbi:MAG: DUF3021 domain-containing protein [Defluviitaleaceae bacterium]|nr:DUF3021 domain-containing protein [Defluviitaleaceae bacterium]